MFIDFKEREADSKFRMARDLVERMQEDFARYGLNKIETLHFMLLYFVAVNHGLKFYYEFDPKSFLNDDKPLFRSDVDISTEIKTMIPCWLADYIDVEDSEKARLLEKFTKIIDTYLDYPKIRARDRLLSLNLFTDLNQRGVDLLHYCFTYAGQLLGY